MKVRYSPKRGPNLQKGSVWNWGWAGERKNGVGQAKKGRGKKERKKERKQEKEERKHHLNILSTLPLSLKADRREAFGTTTYSSYRPFLYHWKLTEGKRLEQQAKRENGVGQAKKGRGKKERKQSKHFRLRRGLLIPLRRR
jgi:hypothetical protein